MDVWRNGVVAASALTRCFCGERSGELEVGVALNQLFRAEILEADGEAAILAFAIHFDDGAEAVFRVADARADERILFRLGRAGAPRRARAGGNIGRAVRRRSSG